MLRRLAAAPMAGREGLKAHSFMYDSREEQQKLIMGKPRRTVSGRE